MSPSASRKRKFALSGKCTRTPSDANEYVSRRRPQSQIQSLSDNDLQAIVLHPADYTPLALKIAEECLQARGLSITVPAAEIDWTDVEPEHPEEADVEDASIGMKVVFGLVPGIGGLVLLIWFLVSLTGKSDPRIAQCLPWVIGGMLFWGCAFWLFQMVAMTGMH